jgi:hypothetical protein
MPYAVYDRPYKREGRSYLEIYQIPAAFVFSEDTPPTKNGI